MFKFLSFGKIRWLLVGFFSGVSFCTSSLATTTNVNYGFLSSDTSIFYTLPVTSRAQNCNTKRAVEGTVQNGQRTLTPAFSINLLSTNTPGLSCNQRMTFSILGFDQCIGGISGASRAPNSVSSSNIIFNYLGTDPADPTLAITAPNPCTGLPLIGCGNSITASNVITCCYSDSGAAGCNFVGAN